MTLEDRESRYDEESFFHQYVVCASYMKSIFTETKRQKEIQYSQDFALCK